MNKKARITNNIIEATLDKSIDYITKNGNRGVRNLVDLGAHFAEGRFQKDFFYYAQQILTNEECVYYDIVKNVVKNTAPNIIKKFGINLGYNSWTYGAKKIREYEQKYGYNIPWTLVFDFEKTALSGKKTSEILDSGTSLGILSEMFFVGSNAPALYSLIPILSTYPDNAFFIFSEPELLTDDTFTQITDAGNIMLMMKMNEHDDIIVDTLNNLRMHKCLYGIYCEYNGQNLDRVISNKNMDRIHKTASPFAFLVKSGHIESIDSLLSFLHKAQENNHWPFFLVDFYHDLAHIDQIISTEDCFIAIKGDGRIAVGTMDSEKHQVNIMDSSLAAILKQTMPPVRYI